MQNCHFINFDITVRGNEAPYTVMAQFAGHVAEGEFDQESSQPYWIDVENQLGNVSRGPGSALMIEAGSTLYNALMRGDLQALWTRARAELSGPEPISLRIRLALYPPTVAALPWECLTDPTRGEIFAANGRTPLIRVENQERYLGPPRQLTAKLPIKILLAVPEDPLGIIDPAEAHQTVKLIRQLGENVATTEVLSGRFSLVDLSRKLSTMQADVLHLITHGEPDGILLWQDGEPAFMPAHTLRIALERTQSVKFVLLNACLAGQSSDRTPFTTVGPQLLQTGIPAVVAMQYEILDADAAEFAQYLYEELLFGPCPGHIDAAVSYARSNLYVSHPDRFSFGTPVLWLNARDGQIFHLESVPQTLSAAEKSTADKTESVSSQTPADDLRSMDRVRTSAPAPDHGISGRSAKPNRPTIEPAELARWLTDRRTAVEPYSQSDAWKLLRFEWQRSTGELEDLIRQFEKNPTDHADSNRHPQTDPAQIERLKRKIGNLAQAICFEAQSDDLPLGSVPYGSLPDGSCRRHGMTSRAPSNTGDGMQARLGRSRSSSLRVGLALTRLLLLYILFCWLIMILGLTLQDARERGLGLTAPPWAGFWQTSEQRLSSETADPNQAAHGLPFVGVNVDLKEMSPGQRTLALDRLSDHGVGWVRQRFDWNVLEPAPGAFDRQQSDAMIAAISASGLTPIVLLDGSPAWARRPQDRPPADNPLAPPAAPADFANFAAAFARRYGDEVRFYQIWDEPNIAPHWGSQHVEPTAYAHLLIQAAQAIRAVDDDAVIIAGALAPTADRGHTAVDEVYFLQRMYAAGVQPHVDMMAIQPFGFGRSAQDPAQQLATLNFQRAALVRRAMVAAGDGSTPLLAARFGWNRRPASPWATVEPGAQQAYLSDALTIGWRRWPWLAGMGWAIDQPGAPEIDPIWGFALDDGLLETVEGWTTATRMVRSGYPAWIPWKGLLATMGLAVVAWRFRTAWRLIPWTAWHSTYRSFRPPVKILLWLCLLTVYYFAVSWPLILLLLIVASILIAMDPRTGLWLAAALLPFHFQHKELTLVNASLTLPPAQAVILTSVPAIVVRVKQNLAKHRSVNLPQMLQPLDWFGIGWLGIGLLTMVNVWHWPAYWTGMMDLMIVPLLLDRMVRLFATDRRSQTIAAVALLAGGVLVATMGLIDWLGGGGTEADALRRLTGPYFSPNHTALYLERSLFLGLGILLFWSTERSTQSGFKSKTTTAVLVTAIGAIGLALLLTASRGALLLGLPVGLALFIGLVVASQPEKVRQSTARSGGRMATDVVAAGVVGAFLLSSFLLAPLIWPRLSNTATMAERIGVWQASWMLWRSMPLLGSGAGGFFWQFPAFIPPGSGLDPNLRHPHNIWLESLTIWGAVGTLWLLAGMGWAIRTVWLERRFISTAAQRGIIIGLLAGLAAGIAHGQVDTFGALADLAAWNWIALGLWRAMLNTKKAGLQG